MLKKSLFRITVLLVGVMLVFALATCLKQSKDEEKVGGVSINSGNGSNESIIRTVTEAIPVQLQQGTQDYEAVTKEMEKLATDVQAGKITQEEYQRRVMEISARMANELGLANMYGQMLRDAEPEQNELGENAGWPPASVFSQYGLPNLKQPSGTVARYSNEGGEGKYHADGLGKSCYIYLSGADHKANVQDLLQQVEKAFGQTIESYGSGENFSADNGNIFIYANKEDDDITRFVFSFMEYNRNN